MLPAKIKVLFYARGPLLCCSAWGNLGVASSNILIASKILFSLNSIFISFSWHKIDIYVAFSLTLFLIFSSHLFLKWKSHIESNVTEKCYKIYVFIFLSFTGTTQILENCESGIPFFLLHMLFKSVIKDSISFGWRKIVNK